METKFNYFLIRAYSILVIYMSKMDEFKKFVSNNPHLKKKINQKETTWQELYEHYDLYGEDDEIFKNKEEEVKEEKKDDEKSLNGLFDMLTGIDIDKIADGLNGMRKVLSILGELTTPNNEDKNMNRREKPFKRDDD